MHTSETNTYEHVHTEFRSGNGDTARVMQWDAGYWWHFETVRAEEIPAVTPVSVAEAQSHVHDVLIMVAAPLADQVRRTLDFAVHNGDAEAIRREGHEWSGQIGLTILKLADAIEENPCP